MPDYFSLEPDDAQMRALAEAFARTAIAFVGELEGRSAATLPDDEEAVVGLAEVPPEAPRPLEEIIASLRRAVDLAIETAGPNYFAWIPGGGLYSAAVTELLTKVTNRFVGLTDIAPGLAAIERGVVDWLCGVCGLPRTSTGILTSGGSTANLSAVLAAREAILEGDPTHGRTYLSEHTHHSIRKALRIAGFPESSIRVVPCDRLLRMDPAVLEEMIAADRRAGLRPFLIVGSAGTTNSGSIDPLAALAAPAKKAGLWFHVDGAYGGLFRLTDRGKERLRGIEEADTITLDPHKSLFLPYGTGALLAREPGNLLRAHGARADYLQDLEDHPVNPDPAEMGIELTRPVRGLQLFVPLHLHGVAAFREALDEKLDLAELAYDRIRAIPGLETIGRPELSVVGFRFEGDGPTADRRSHALLRWVNDSGRAYLSSTNVEGRFTIRVCILSHRTHRKHVEGVIELIAEGAAEFLKRPAC